MLPHTPVFLSFFAGKTFMVNTMIPINFPDQSVNMEVFIKTLGKTTDLNINKNNHTSCSG